MLAYDPATNPLNSNEWAFPLAEVIHIAAMALAIGTIAMVDLRLLGVGFRRQTAAALVAETQVWTLSGLAVVIASGLAIFSSDPVMYANNSGFLFKMAALATATVFNYTVHRRAAKGDPPGLFGAAAAAVSLLLWVSVVAAGIFTAFV